MKGKERMKNEDEIEAKGWLENESKGRMRGKRQAKGGSGRRKGKRDREG